MKLPNKWCYHCKSSFPLECFGNNKAKLSGLADECKPCARTRQHNYIKRRNFVRIAYNHSLRGQYHIYKHKAKANCQAFELTLKEFESFNEDQCHYCGTKTTKVGLDRIDNNEGYHIYNVVRCCKICNISKNNRTLKEFIIHCKKVGENYACA